MQWLNVIKQWLLWRWQNKQNWLIHPLIFLFNMINWLFESNFFIFFQRHAVTRIMTTETLQKLLSICYCSLNPNQLFHHMSIPHTYACPLAFLLDWGYSMPLRYNHHIMTYSYQARETCKGVMALKHQSISKKTLQNYFSHKQLTVASVKLMTSNVKLMSLQPVNFGQSWIAFPLFPLPPQWFIVPVRNKN